jgi:4-amino-4-deoxy-L-arabinose transferase-like glycosyltransferase
MNKKVLFLIVFGVLIFGIRLVNINEAIYDDESNFAYSLTVMNEFGFNEKYYSPQLSNLIYKPFISSFGLKTWVFRLIPWLFGIINTVFVYIFARRNWGEKVAFWASFLMLIAFYPTLASLQFDVEGNLVMFSIMLLFFSYLEYEKVSSKRIRLGWQILSGVGLGVAIASKYNSIYIVVVLALYSLIKGKFNLKQSFQDVFFIYLVGLLVFLCQVFLAAISSPDWFSIVFNMGTGTVKYFSHRISLLAIGMFVLWSTPLLSGFYLISLKLRKRMLLPFLWITLAICYYVFIQTYGAFDRYLMNIIPALAILGGFYISKENLKEKHAIFGSILFFFSLLFFFIVNSLPIKYVARFPELYLRELKGFNLNFLFAYTSSSGPTFGVNFATIFWGFLMGFGCLILYLILNKKMKSLSKYFFAGFLAIFLAFNVFLVSEYIFHPTGVDVSEIKWQMMDYVGENNLNYPIYTNDQGIQWYFDHDYWGEEIQESIGFADNEINSKPVKAVENIGSGGGTVVLLYWPPLPIESPAWEVVRLCDLEKQFYSNDILTGEIYTC